jgi:hypothetical protein
MTEMVLATGRLVLVQRSELLGDALARMYSGQPLEAGAAATAGVVLVFAGLLA